MNPFSKLFKGRSVPPPADTSRFRKTERPPADTFDRLVERHAGLSFEKQHLLAEVIGSGPWQLDMADGEISFGELRLPIQIIGSLAFDANSWMWAWANTASRMPEPLLANARELRRRGEALGIPELTTPTFEATPQLEHRIGLLACGAFGASSYYSANYGKGTLVVTVDSSHVPAVDPARVERILTTFPQLISAVPLDHRNALINYLLDRDFALDVQPSRVEGLRDGQPISAEFDDAGRLTALRGKLG